jgi:hypothetical protein
LRLAISIGVDGAGKSTVYRRSLQGFWAGYFEKCRSCTGKVLGADAIARRSFALIDARQGQEGAIPLFE